MPKHTNQTLKEETLDFTLRQNSRIIAVGDKDGGVPEEANAIKQMHLIADYVNDSKYLVNLQMSNTKLVLRGSVVLMHVKCAFIYSPLAKYPLDADGGHGATWRRGE